MWWSCEFLKHFTRCIIFWIFWWGVVFLCSCSFSVLLLEAIFTPHKCLLLGWMKVHVVNVLGAKCFSGKKRQHVSMMLVRKHNVSWNLPFFSQFFILSFTGRYLTVFIGLWGKRCICLPDHRYRGEEEQAAPGYWVHCASVSLVSLCMFSTAHPHRHLGFIVVGHWHCFNSVSTTAALFGLLDYWCLAGRLLKISYVGC